MKKLILAVAVLSATPALADGRPIFVPQSDLLALSQSLAMAIRGCAQQPDALVLGCAESVLISAQKLQQAQNAANAPAAPPPGPVPIAPAAAPPPPPPMAGPH